MSLLECENVAFAYEGTEVLKNISFTVNEGDYLCIVGENGAGKSTLIKGILNLKKPSAGQIIAGDGLMKSEIGYLPQQTVVQKDFPASVYEVVQSGRLNKLGFRLFYGKEDKKHIEHALELMDIKDLKNRCYRDLSGGQQQRVLLARALCATEKMLLLDEPVTGLDPIMAKDMYNLIKKINREDNITIIMVSHDINGVIEDATHVLHIGKEQTFFGKTKDYLDSEVGHSFVSTIYTAQ